MTADISSIPVADRHKAREIALQILFQREFVRDVDIQTSLEYFHEIVTASPAAWRYTEFLLKGVSERLSDIDAAISAKSKNWKIARISPVDLSILRVGVFEIMFTDTAQKADVPPKAVINEAVEIARRYGSTDSSAFINGILDAIMEQRAAT